MLVVGFQLCSKPHQKNRERDNRQRPPLSPLGATQEEVGMLQSKSVWGCDQNIYNIWYIIVNILYVAWLIYHTTLPVVCTLVNPFDFDLARLAATRKRLLTSLTATPKSSWICPCNLLEKQRSTADLVHKQVLICSHSSRSQYKAMRFTPECWG